MWETILLNIVAPAIVAVVTAWGGFKFGRKKTKEEIEKDKAETSVMIVDLVNKQLALAYERIYKLEEEVAVLKAQNNSKDDKLDDKRAIIRAATTCSAIPRAECPVLKKEADIDELNTKLRLAKAKNSDTAVKIDCADK